MKLSPGRAIAISLGCITWSLLVHALMVQLHNRVEYFLMGPVQIFLIGMALAPLIFAIVCLFLPQARALKAAMVSGLVIPALLTLSLLLATLFSS